MEQNESQIRGGRPKTIGEILASALPGRSPTFREERECRSCGRTFIAYRPDSTLCRECSAAAYRTDIRSEGLERVEREMPAARAKWLARSGLPEDFQGKTLAGFRPAAALTAAIEAIRTFDWRGRKSLALAGGYGLGKTHLLAALANRIIADGEPAVWDEGRGEIAYPACPVRYVTETELLRRLRATYQQDARETEDGVYRELSRPRLLLLDDVGKVRARDLTWTQGVYFNLIDDRYSRGLPIVLTTNLEWTELEAHIGGACADRLREMCGRAGLIRLIGESKRRG